MADAAVEIVIVGKTNLGASLTSALAAPKRAAHVTVRVGTVESREAIATCRRTYPRRTGHKNVWEIVVRVQGLEQLEIHIEELYRTHKIRVIQSIVLRVYRNEAF